jgi:acetyl-CoA/propionyl-CoA carboxylase
MAKLCTWGQTFEESRLRMLNALNDFYIQGVETSIPLYKTILKTDEYKNGQLTTDFLKRFGMIERLEEDLKNDKKQKEIPAIASAIMYSEFFQSIVKSQNHSSSSWKNTIGGM